MPEVPTIVTGISDTARYRMGRTPTQIKPQRTSFSRIVKNCAVFGLPMRSKGNPPPKAGNIYSTTETWAPDATPAHPDAYNEARPETSDGSAWGFFPIAGTQCCRLSLL
ncbi:hypothetical protein CH63R_11370 [Colletotrichum higginsianum IMI 349063]|uniref:Uncharacterized protein n=1 Tax=Colletotrichum higginsianum (strain IMI 349063) TaxID=759273 RepID=A0A1B7XY18_COLHI|nr:hypothetical protein CH63R_11370 [Colletotrichum higginsianum IMI 349063]OBR04667.1 hypothetical protein CH63R_11370 [Colletotrichum higginsianum IMI 349063]